MKLKHLLLTLLLLILAGVLAGCAGGSTVASSWPGLAADKNTAYLASGEHVYAVNIANGTEKWEYPTQADRKTTFYSDPVISGQDSIIVGSYNNDLYNLNPDGIVNWTFSGAKNRYVASPLVTDKEIFAPSADKTVYALDLNGNLLWKFTTRDEMWAQPATDPACQCVYLPSMDHHIYALNAQDGSKKWQTEDLGGAIVGNPSYDEKNGRLYVGTLDKEVIAINVNDGSVPWRAATEGWVWSGPALANGRLYVGDLDGYFYAFDAANGGKLWELTPDQLDGRIPGKPLVLGNQIYFTSESGSLHAVGTDGKLLWSKTVGGKLYTPPVAAGDLILVAPMGADSSLVAFTADGNQKWSFAPPKQK